MKTGRRTHSICWKASGTRSNNPDCCDFRLRPGSGGTTARACHPCGAEPPGPAAACGTAQQVPPCRPYRCAPSGQPAATIAERPPLHGERRRATAEPALFGAPVRTVRRRSTPPPRGGGSANGPVAIAAVNGSPRPTDSSNPRKIPDPRAVARMHIAAVRAPAL